MSQIHRILVNAGRLRPAGVERILTDDHHVGVSMMAEQALFFEAFARWNSDALPIMNRISEPYLSQQQAVGTLAAEVATDGFVLDFGCGLGGSSIEMLKRSGNRDIEGFLAIDPDASVLQHFDDNVRASSFFRDVCLVQGSSTVPLPVHDESLAIILSGLGGLTYTSPFMVTIGPPAEFVHGREALRHCLKDCARALRPGGYVVFSSLLPDPDFDRIKSETIGALARGFRFGDLLLALRVKKKVQKASEFMLRCAQQERAHYLSREDWIEYLDEAGFEVDKVVEGIYADQGIAIRARKR